MASTRHRNGDLEDRREAAHSEASRWIVRLLHLQLIGPYLVDKTVMEEEHRIIREVSHAILPPTQRCTRLCSCDPTVLTRLSPLMVIQPSSRLRNPTVKASDLVRIRKFRISPRLCRAFLRLTRMPLA